MGMLSEFKEFAVKGNVIDLAVGVIIGGAFAPIVKSLVDNVIMPPIGLALGRMDFSNLFLVLKEGAVTGPYLTLDAAQKAGAVVIGYGTFLTTVINFIIVAFAIFLMVRTINRLKREAPPPPAPPPVATKEEILLGEIRDVLKQQRGV